MEPMTALVLALQLIALFSIAGALIVYLLCNGRGESVVDGGGADKSSAAPAKPTSPHSVLITSADTALGLQLCTHLANKGCRVFAGMKEVENSLPAKLLCGWMQMRECKEEPVRGSIIIMQMDITRDDMLREALITIGSHLNAGESGIAAVINTSGTCYRGRVESQNVQQWEQMLKTNILGSLRLAKTFVGYLRPTQGRLIYLGAGNEDDGLVAYNASRMAVEKCAAELRKELQPYGISVIALDTCGVAAEELYKAPVPQVSDAAGAPKQYTANVLTTHALGVIERALWDVPAEDRYRLTPPHSKFNFTLPCRSSLRLMRSNSTAGATDGGCNPTATATPATTTRIQRV